MLQQLDIPVGMALQSRAEMGAFSPQSVVSCIVGKSFDHC